MIVGTQAAYKFVSDIKMIKERSVMRLAYFLTIVVASVSLLVGQAVASGSQSGGTPSVPCYINGSYVGTLMITECHRRGGSVYQDRSSRSS